MKIQFDFTAEEIRVDRDLNLASLHKFLQSVLPPSVWKTFPIDKVPDPFASVAATQEHVMPRTSISRGRPEKQLATTGVLNITLLG